MFGLSTLNSTKEIVTLKIKENLLISQIQAFRRKTFIKRLFFSQEMLSCTGGQILSETKNPGKNHRNETSGNNYN